MTAFSIRISMAKDNLKLTRRRTLVSQRRRIMSKSEGSRTRVLKISGINRRLTSLRVIEMIPTTKFIRVKSFTPTLTRNNRTITQRNAVLQRTWTRGNKVRLATHYGTLSFTFVRRNRHRNVETVHQTHAVRWEVIVAVVYVELS